MTSEILELPTSTVNRKLKLSGTGKFLVGVTGGIAVGLTVICAPFISPALRRVCLPYVPATSTQLENIAKALRNKSGSLLDIGSGDGRIVIEAAKKQFKSDGVELNPWLVLYSKYRAYREGLSKSAKFYKADLWKYKVDKYDNIVIFGVEQMMADLENKFLVECKDNCSIIACRFPLPNIEPVQTIGEGIDTVWVYNLKKSKDFNFQKS